MIELYRNFTRSMAWNAFESVLYQLALLGHQLVLFQATPHATYGLIGTIFSLIYLCALITNFGLDVSLGVFIKQATASRQNFKKLFYLQLLPEYTLLASFFIIALLCQPLLGQQLILQYGLSKSMIVILASLVFFEGTKKTLRMILQLAFMNHKTAIVEVATIISYISMVWIGYFLGYPISIPLVFIPMLITSVLSWVVLCIFVYDFYRELPATSLDEVSWDTQWRMVHNRFFNFLNQISHMVFSSNFLVPFFAVLFGLGQAGLLKIVSYISYCITVILQKVFGLSGNMLLAHLKDAPHEDKQHAFVIITNYLHQALYGIIIFFIINHQSLSYLNSLPAAGITLSLMYLFLIINFSENFFIAYEKFYITQEKAGHLFMFNIIVMSLLGLVIYHAAVLSQLTLLLLIISIRLIAFLGLSFLSFYQWRIKPTFAIHPRYALYSFLFSVGFFILLRL